MAYRWHGRQDASGREVPALPLTVVGETMPSPKDSAAELRARAARARRLAETFRHDESAPRLRTLADELQARADALEGAVAGNVDEGRA
jgi:hypothetical protein